MTLEIGQKLWHPCSIDIMEHEVISKTEYIDRVVYATKATHNIGACGKVEVELVVDKENKIRCIGLISNCEHGSGLQDFIDGFYFVTRKEARKAYYDIQKTLAYSNMNNKKRLYEEAKEAYDKCCLVLKELK